MKHKIDNRVQGVLEIIYRVSSQRKVTCVDIPSTLATLMGFADSCLRINLHFDDIHRPYYYNQPRR